ncbi:hypothetical protein CC1G_10933 [Coprinopsis cinerea okayama7|uniref:C2H2-type domain-containing protein n=1 Tax=Coprinopsis cinerea (strain Okayama-7 / 130 / ATCC MYA-4618 / FGSC 9003) TaxID=240176 RepID=A8NT41_COPC7|nr:hypothetical protein CC1G_10933 [Coprinopsis cinerea okayama7\|eukprot:XP_001836152.2 hypothetical protein CC1G_10933 [Coprinopsis cinerea okayama7\
MEEPKPPTPTFPPAGVDERKSTRNPFREQIHSRSNSLARLARRDPRLSDDDSHNPPHSPSQRTASPCSDGRDAYEDMGDRYPSIQVQPASGAHILPSTSKVRIDDGTFIASGLDHNSITLNLNVHQASRNPLSDIHQVPAHASTAPFTAGSAPLTHPPTASPRVRPQAGIHEARDAPYSTNSTPQPPIPSTLPPTGMSSASFSPEPICLPAQGKDIYERHLLLLRHGWPLWIPHPSIRLPISYVEKGVSVGDVGIITQYGAFDYLFNILLPADHPDNAGPLPAGFVPLNIQSKDIHEYPEHMPGSYFASSSTMLTAGYSGLTFTSMGSEGAILTLPDGAHHQDIHNLKRFRDYAAAHVVSWYKFVNGTCGREIENGRLHLVTGCDKTSSWGMAAFLGSQVSSEPLSLTFTTQVGATGPTYGWEHTGHAEVKACPAVSTPGQNTLRNQCTFIRSITLSLSDDEWEDAMAAIDVPSDSAPDTSTASESDTGGSHSSSGSRNPLRQLLSKFGFSNSGKSSSTRTQGALTMKPFSDLPLQCPEARVAMTHDSDWAFLSDQALESFDITQILGEIMTFDATLDSGAIYLCASKQQGESSHTQGSCEMATVPNSTDTPDEIEKLFQMLGLGRDEGWQTSPLSLPLPIPAPLSPHSHLRRDQELSPKVDSVIYASPPNFGTDLDVLQTPPFFDSPQLSTSSSPSTIASPLFVSQESFSNLHWEESHYMGFPRQKGTVGDSPKPVRRWDAGIFYDSPSSSPPLPRSFDSHSGLRPTSGSSRFPSRAGSLSSERNYPWSISSGRSSPSLFFTPSESGSSAMSQLLELSPPSSFGSPDMHLRDRYVSRSTSLDKVEERPRRHSFDGLSEAGFSPTSGSQLPKAINATFEGTSRTRQDTRLTTVTGLQGVGVKRRHSFSTLQRSPSATIDISASHGLSHRRVMSQSGMKANPGRRSKEARFSCTLCGLTFTTNHNLKIHMNVHLGVKAHSCVHCGRAFTTQSVLARHMKTCKSNPEKPQRSQLSQTLKTDE